MIKRIVSGGQTGVDRAALDAANKWHIATGGWCPKFRKAEDGTIPEIYPLSETPSVEFDQRTEWNVRDSDGTMLIVRGAIFGGTLFAKTICHQTNKPCCIVDLTAEVQHAEILNWLERNRISVLNIAGPRESHLNGIYEDAKEFVSNLLELIIHGQDRSASQNGPGEHLENGAS